MTSVGRKHGPGADRILADCQWMLGPTATARRQWAIAALPRVVWKNRILYTIRCQGWSGRGPHDVNVPLLLLWSLMDLNYYFCPYHAADSLRPPMFEEEWPM